MDLWKTLSYGSVILGVVLFILTSFGLDKKRSRKKLKSYLLPILCILWGILIFRSQGFAFADTDSEAIKVTSIYWSDGDSGQINGTFKFRLNDVDAPETGGVGAAIGAAQCELERERGFDSKKWVVTLTKGAALEISQTYDLDRYGRTVIDLSVNGQDLGARGLAAGHYKPWPHDGSKAQSKRPVWC